MTYQAIADAAGVSFGTAYGTTKDVELIKIDKLPGADGKARPPAYTRKLERRQVLNFCICKSCPAKTAKPVGRPRTGAT